MTLIRQFSDRSAIVGEVFTFLWQRKLWWLVPLAMLILILGILFAFAQVSSVAPWMYPL
jgi:beta-lactamase regulating signal transducer with metallopeptidase domain